MYERAEDDDVGQRDALGDEEGARQQVRVQHLQSRQQVLLRALYILQTISMLSNTTVESSRS